MTNKITPTNKLICEEVAAVEWENFHKSSPQATIFSTPLFVNSLAIDVRFILVKKGREVVGGIPILHSGSDVLQPAYTINCGIHYADLSNLKSCKKTELEFKISEIIADHLFSHYDEAAFVNHPSVIDIRAFQWFNYGRKHELGGYDIIPQFTSWLNGSIDSLSDGFRQSRRYDVNLAIKEGAAFQVGGSLKILDQLHRLTFERQKISRSIKDGYTLMTICENLIKAEKGELFITFIKGTPVSASFWAFDKNFAYYLFGASNPDFRHMGVGSHNVALSIEKLRLNKKINNYDFIGINSPNRGDFKLGFGGSVISYYKVVKICAKKEL